MKKLLSILVAIVAVVLFPNLFQSSILQVSAEQSGDFTYSISGSTATITGYAGVGGTVEIPSMLGTYTVTSIARHVFYNNATISKVTIPNSVSNIGSEAFGFCAGLTSITIPDSVTSIGEYAFTNCSGLTSVTIPSNVTSIAAWVFSGCTGLTSVTIPSNVTSIGDYAFSWCTGLTSVSIPSSVTIIGDSFYGCLGLTSVIIPKSVTYAGARAFYHCLGLMQIEVDNNNSQFSSLDGVLFRKDRSMIVKYPAGKTGSIYSIPSDVKSIGAQAFDECTRLTSVNIPNNVTSISVEAFNNCTGLTSVTIPSSVTSIGDGAFFNCNRLTSVTISSGVTSIGAKAFAHCTGLTSVTILYNVITIGDEAFFNCSRLTSVTIPISVTSIGAQAFAECSGLKQIIVDNNNTQYSSLDGVLFSKDRSIIVQYPAGKIGNSYSIPSSVTSIGDGAFYWLLRLTSVTIPSSVTSIGVQAFYLCAGLTSMPIPSGVTNIGNSAFAYCKGLTSVTIPSGVTSIGDWTFCECTGLISVTIPSSVTSIGYAAFYGCGNLEKVIFNGNSPTMGHNVFDCCAIDFTIYYLADKTGFTTPTWYGYPTKVFQSPNLFSVAEDGYCIVNYGPCFGYPVDYSIPRQRYVEVYGEVGRLIPIDDWYGNCFGMMTTSLLFDSGLLNSTYYTGYNTLNNALDGEKDNRFSFDFPYINKDSQLTELIESYQLLDHSKWFADITEDYNNKYWELNPNGETSDGKYIEYLLNELRKDGASVIALYTTINLKKAGHAVARVTDRPVEDMGNGWFRVYVYDPNNPYYQNANNLHLPECYANYDNKYIELNPELNQWRYLFSANIDGAGSIFFGYDKNGQYIDGSQIFTVPLDNLPSPVQNIPFMPPESDMYLAIDAETLDIFDKNNALLFSLNEGVVSEYGVGIYYMPDMGYMPGSTTDNKAHGRIMMPQDSIIVVLHDDSKVTVMADDNIVYIDGGNNLAAEIDASQKSISVTSPAENNNTNIQISHISTSDDFSSMKITGQLDSNGQIVMSLSDDGIITVESAPTSPDFDISLDSSIFAQCIEVDGVSLNDYNGVDVETVGQQVINNGLITGLSMSKSESEILVGSSLILLATVSPYTAANKSVQWSSSNPAVASVDGTGKVTALKKGSTIITATTVDGNKSDYCTINVVEPPVTTTYVVNGSYISGVNSGTTVDALVGSFRFDDTVDASVKKADGTIISGSAKVGTGTTISFTDGAGTVFLTYTIVIYGDTTGDGSINALDLIAVKRHILGLQTLSGANATAANTDHGVSGSINALDLLKIKRQILGLEVIVQ